MNFENFIEPKRLKKIEDEIAAGFSNRQHQREKYYAAKDARQKPTQEWYNRHYG